MSPTNNQPPTYLVTGGAGFVGSNLVAELLRRSPRPRVVVIDSFRSGSYANIVEACARKGVGAFDGRIITQSSADADWLDLIEHIEPSAVFHLGAITDTTISDEPLMLRENVQGFVSMMHACATTAMGRAAIPLVYASSAATYGTPPHTAQRKPFPESAAGMPNNVYGFSKWLMECEHRRFAESQPPEDAFGRPSKPPYIVGLRYFNVFGPGEARKGKMASMVYQLARQMLAGDRPRVFRDGSHARDQVSVDDVVDCTIAASGLPGHGSGEGPLTPGVYNLGSGAATSFNQIIAAVREALNLTEASRPTDYFDMPPAIRAFYQDFTQADMTRPAQGLLWKPRHPPAAAITRYARWLAKHDAFSACE